MNRVLINGFLKPELKRVKISLRFKEFIEWSTNIRAYDCPCEPSSGITSNHGWNQVLPGLKCIPPIRTKFKRLCRRDVFLCVNKWIMMTFLKKHERIFGEKWDDVLNRFAGGNLCCLRAQLEVYKCAVLPRAVVDICVVYAAISSSFMFALWSV